MKKFGFIIFIIALIIGVVIANLFSFGKVNASNYINFSFDRSIKGSGNQVTETRNVDEFFSVDASGVFKVEIISQKDFSVSVDADDNLLPHIKTEVKNGELKIFSERRIKSSNPIRIRITAPNVERIEASGATNIDISDLKNSSFEVDTSGASKVKVSGETADLNIDISGAGNVNSSGLTSQKAKVDASGASRVSVNAVTELDVDASGASNVTFSGSPVTISKRSSGASKITQE